ncbi:MAG: hypothetical protein JNM57_13255 [Cyclobacteriaceae bacterium]|nr:hypothetical protein [Cyclobacteriaceae bacterium]
MNALIVIAVALVAVYIIYRILKTLVKWVIIIGLVALAFAYLSNPTESDHRSQLKSLLPDIAVQVQDDAVKVDDYKVFSLAKVTRNGNEKISGIGAFGKVWLFEDALSAFAGTKKN